MIGLQKKRPAPGEYIVPNNSVLNVTGKVGPYDPTPNAMEQSTKGGSEGKCRYCENMAKNFLYLESLIRNNGDKAEKKCSLCNSSLKYLEYVNRNIRQVFGNFDAIVQADRALAARPATLPKYSVGAAPEMDIRAKGGANVTTQKPLKSLKPKTASLKVKSKSKSLDKFRGFKSQKSLKSLRSLRSSKSTRSTKSTKSSKSAKSTKSTKSTKSSKTTKPVKGARSSLKLAKSGSKALRKGLAKSKSSGLKSQISHGKMVLKRKFRNKVGSKLGSSKMVRSVSQYRGLAASRSKLSKEHSHSKLVKQRSAAPPTSINWRLLKQNLPKPKPTFVK
ncbi:hypothetical protein KR054_004581 [Drosophila jambulina]|nr:hypothetical protein KR054_004581 [Drosophila jambulina]